MPGGYGKYGTPWGRGGSGAETSAYAERAESNVVADKVNAFQQAKRKGESPEVVQELQRKAINEIAKQQAYAGADVTAEGQLDVGPAQKQYEISKQKITDRIAQQQAEEAEKARIAALPKTGIFSGFEMPSLPTPLGMGIEFLRGLGGKDRVFKKLAAGEALTEQDKIILANLIAANKENPNVFGDLSKYTTEDVDVEELGERLQDAVRPLEVRAYDQEYQSLIDEYKTGKPTGLGGLFGIGEERTEGLTLEKLKDEIGPVGLAFLKANMPQEYYKFTTPSTTGELEELAGETTFTGKNLTQKQKDFNQQIFDARAELDRQKGDQGGGGGAGIADLSPLQQLAATVPAATTTAAATVPAATVPAATTTAAAATAPTPFDYSQWPQYAATNQYPWPNYVNQGLGQRPEFDYFNRIARTYPGMMS